MATERCSISGPSVWVIRTGIKDPDGWVTDTKRSFCTLSLQKCISIFHLPPFSVYLSNYQRNEWVEDSVFKPFIFHFHLPSSTHCFWWIRYWSVIVYSVLSICLCRLKHFLFLSIFSENGPDFISSRMSGPISPHTCAHEPVYPGPPARVYGLR